MNYAAMNVGVQMSVHVPLFSSFGYTHSEVEMMDHMVILCLIFLRISHIVLQNSCAILHSHQQKLPFNTLFSIQAPEIIRLD